MFSRANAVDSDGFALKESESAHDTHKKVELLKPGKAFVTRPPTGVTFEPATYRDLFRAVGNLVGQHVVIGSLSSLAETEGGAAPLQLLDCARRYGKALAFYAGYLAPTTALKSWVNFTAFERTFRYWLIEMAPGLQSEDLSKQPRKHGELPTTFASNPEEFTRHAKDFRFAGAVFLATAPLEVKARAASHTRVLRSVCHLTDWPDEGIRYALDLDLDRVGEHIVWASPIVQHGILKFLRALSLTDGYAEGQKKFERPIKYLKDDAGSGIALFGGDLTGFSGEELSSLKKLFSRFGRCISGDTWRLPFAKEVREILPNVRPFSSTFGETGLCLVKALGLDAFRHLDRLHYIVNKVRESFRLNDTEYDLHKTLEALTPVVVKDTTDTALHVYLAAGSQTAVIRPGFNLFLGNEALRKETRWITENAALWTANVLGQYPLEFFCNNPDPIRRLLSITRPRLMSDAVGAVARHLSLADLDVIDQAIHHVGSHAWGALEGGGTHLVSAFRENPKALEYTLAHTGAGAGHFFAKVPVAHWFSVVGKKFIDYYGEAAGKEYRARCRHPDVDDDPKFREVVQDNKSAFGIQYPSRYCEEDLAGGYHWDLLEENLRSLDPEHKSDLPPCVVLVAYFDDGNVLSQVEILKQLQETHKVFIFEVGSPADIDAARRHVTSIVMKGGNPLDDRARVLLFAHGHPLYLPLSTPPNLRLPDETHDLVNADWALTKESISVFARWGEVLLPPGSRFLPLCCTLAQGGRDGDNFWRRLKENLPQVYVNGSRIASGLNGLRYDRLNRPSSIAFTSPRKTQLLG